MYMNGPPREAIIWTRERRYFFTSRSHRMKTTLMRLSPAPGADELPHLVCGCGAIVADRVAGELEERGFQRVGAGLSFKLGGRAGGDEAAVVDHGDAVGDAVRLVHVVGREKHGDALGVAEVAHVGPHLVAALRIEAQRRLV